MGVDNLECLWYNYICNETSPLSCSLVCERESWGLTKLDFCGIIYIAKAERTDTKSLVYNLETIGHSLDIKTMYIY